MREFVITVSTVAVMLLCAVPGYILVRAKAVKGEHIPSFSRVLMFVCQPALTLYSFDKATYTPRLARDLLIFFAVVTAAQLLFLAVMWLIFRRRAEQVRYRIASVASVLANCSFIGVPLLEAIFPQSTSVAAYSMMYFLSMNLLGWTLISAMITRDTRHIRLRTFILNPATLSVAVALPLFFLGFKFDGHGAFFSSLGTMLSVLGKMTTPLCMLVLGMRLATLPPRTVFCDPLAYVTVGIHQLIFPLFVFAVVLLLRVPTEAAACMVLMSACPIAAVVQNYAEMLGQGQDAAATVVLLGMVCSVLTLPVMSLLLPLL